MTTGAAAAKESIQSHQPLEQIQTDYELSLKEQIRQKAYEIWLENGCQSGTDLKNWLEAETEILGEDQS